MDAMSKYFLIIKSLYFQMEISWKNWCKPIAKIFLFPFLLFIKMYKILRDLESPDEEERTFQQQKGIEDYESCAVRRSSLDQETVPLENELEQIQLTENSQNEPAFPENAELQRLQTQGTNTSIDIQLSTSICNLIFGKRTFKVESL